MKLSSVISQHLIFFRKQNIVHLYYWNLYKGTKSIFNTSLCESYVKHVLRGNFKMYLQSDLKWLYDIGYFIHLAVITYVVLLYLHVTLHVWVSTCISKSNEQVAAQIGQIVNSLHYIQMIRYLAVWDDIQNTQCRGVMTVMQQSVVENIAKMTLERFVHKRPCINSASVESDLWWNAF